VDEMNINIKGKTYYLWRAVDQDGNVLDILMQSRRDKAAGERRMRKFKSPCLAQRFLCAFEFIRGHFHPKQHLFTAREYRQEMRQ